MHQSIKHSINHLSKSIIFIFLIFSGFNASAEQSIEELIKSRKALFSKNYNTAKKVQSLSSSGDFERAKKFMIEMSENYQKLKEMFPENTKEGFKTEALPIIWKEKDAYDSLFDKSSKNMIQLVSMIENSENVRSSLGKLMWNNCKSCHGKYRAEH